MSDYGRQLTLKADAFEVSFLPKGCTPEYTKGGKWAKKNRQSGKPGKIIQKVIGAGVFPILTMKNLYMLLKHYGLMEDMISNW